MRIRNGENMRDKKDNLNAGECAFALTGANDLMLRVFMKYALSLDAAAGVFDETETLTIDGVINYLLDDALTRKTKEIIKRHGFENSSDFLDSVSACKDGAEVRAVCVDKERSAALAMRDRILEQIPIDDKQKRLPI